MILVFGSINLDLIFSLPALPREGETVLGPSYRVAPGGKGANQALAAARDGAEAALIGRVGADGFARMALELLRGSTIELGAVAAGTLPTGCAAVCVDPGGRNLIAVASGANREASADQVADARLGRDTTLVMQMEVPVAENGRLIERARRAGARIVLNLAPAQPLPEAALAAVDVLIVNEGEGRMLCGALGLAADVAAAGARGLATRLGIAVAMTLGGEGAVAVSAGEAWRVGALPIEPIDTTGAGDAFVGVLASSLDRGLPLSKALHRASVAGGLACLVPGAQPSLPTRQAIDEQLVRLPEPLAI